MNNKSYIDVRWLEQQPIIINDYIKNADLSLKDKEGEALTCNGSYEKEVYSCLEAKFHLKREIGAALIATYVPTFFIIMISWISFWLDPGSAPARVGLSITTLLTFSTQSAAIRSGLPPVNYAKALDFWLFGCLIFLFAALVEFAIVNTYLRMSNSFTQRRKEATLALSIKQQAVMCGSRCSLALNNTNNNMGALKTNRLLNGSTEYLDSDGDMDKAEEYVCTSMKMAKEFQQKAIALDKLSRTCFPIAFLAFMIVYWSVVLSA